MADEIRVKSKAVQSIDDFAADMRNRGLAVDILGDKIIVKGLPGFGPVISETDAHTSDITLGFAAYVKSHGMMEAMKLTRRYVELSGVNARIAWNRAARMFTGNVVSLPIEIFTLHAKRVTTLEEQIDLLNKQVSTIASFLSQRFGYGSKSLAAKPATRDDSALQRTLERLKA